MYLLLGRFGDVATILPALKHEFDLTGKKPKLVVAEAYASILHGVSYVEGVVWPHSFERPIEAGAWAHQSIPEPIVDCSVHGVNVQLNKSMSSFDREVWRLSKCPLAFEAGQLVFDRRDKGREDELVNRVLSGRTKPIILTALRGTSSPFPHAREMLDKLIALLPEYDVVDISDVKAEMPYDLLALYEEADGLVATDSFPLHLANAVPNLAVAALITDGPSPWHRSAWRSNHIARVLYSDALKDVEKVARAVSLPAIPTLLHVTSGVPAVSPPEVARLARAEAGRNLERKNGRWVPIIFEPTRDATSIGDRPVPFVRDLIEGAVNSADNGEDIVVLCNFDIGFTPGLTGAILDEVPRKGAAFAHRWDFFAPRGVPTSEHDLSGARWYAGSDLFAFTVNWWNAHQAKFPDMVLGREAWDMIMRNLIKSTNGGGLHRAIWHEKHPPLWESNRRLPGNEHNRRLAHLWLARYGGDWNDWKGPQKYRG